MAAVLYHSKAKGTEKIVLLGIANHMTENGAYPSIPTLTRYANVDERNVRRAISKLVEMNELSLEVHGGYGPNGRKTNLYHVLVKCPVGCSGGYRHVVREGARTPSHDVRNSDGGAPATADTSTSYIATSVKAVTPNGVTSLTTLRVEEIHEDEEYISMAWPGFEDEAPAVVKPRHKPAVETEVGVVGKIDGDKQAKRNAKYKTTKFDAVSASSVRHERPEADWTTNDLVAEFYALSRDKAPGIVSQVNGGQLAAWINRQVGQGVPRIRVLRALRAFFDDPRNLHAAGSGQPLWRRFMAFFPSAQVQDPGFDYDSDSEKALMARMEAKALRDYGLE
jgi:hypothetical protein